MNNILIKPRNAEEYSFVNEFIKRTKLKSEVFDNEELDDVAAYDKAIRRIKKGKAVFIEASEAFAEIEAKRNVSGSN